MTLKGLLVVALLALPGMARAEDLAARLGGEPDGWCELHVAEFNRRIAAAVAMDEAWPRSPLELVLQLVDGDRGAREVALAETKGAGENPDRATIDFIRDGYLDDSIRGEWHRFSLQRLDDGTWVVAHALVAYRCRRSGDPDAYGAEPCP